MFLARTHWPSDCPSFHWTRRAHGTIVARRKREMEKQFKPANLPTGVGVYRKVNEHKGFFARFLG
jgi:hypothetical protein